eukprot:3689230-Amphidinium_carterae.1
MPFPKQVFNMLTHGSKTTTTAKPPRKDTLSVQYNHYLRTQEEKLHALGHSTLRCKATCLHKTGLSSLSLAAGWHRA